MKKFVMVLLISILGIVFFSTFFHPLTKIYQTTNQSAKTTANTFTSQGKIPPIPFSLPDHFTIHVFAKNLTNPRDMQFSPDGTLIVSSPKADTVYALPDKNDDGVADNIIPVISEENHVHGLAFYNNKLYIADVDKVVRYKWNSSNMTATKEKILFSLPPNNDHNNRTLLFDNAGNMFVSVGSTCNVCHELSPLSGTVIESNANGGNPHIFATGLRNAAFLAINPSTQEIWATEMGRDYLGDNIPPDEIDIVKENQDYGWPYCYGNKVHDNNFDPSHTHSCDTTAPPIFNIPAHAAPLGLTFINSSQFPKDWQGDLLVAYHGDWNRSTPIGFKIVHLKVQGDAITGSEDFLTGFLQSPVADDALGRPVDMIFDNKGNLYISDDKAGAIYIVQKE